MQQNATEIVLVNTTATATANGSEITIPGGYNGAIFLLNCTARSGTSPTLLLRLQDVITGAATSDLVGKTPTGTVQYFDWISFPSISATGTTITRMSQYQTGIVAPGVGSAGDPTLQQYATNTGTLGQATLRTGPFPRKIRAQYTIGGTNPSFTFYVIMQLVP